MFLLLVVLSVSAIAETREFVNFDYSPVESEHHPVFLRPLPQRHLFAPSTSHEMQLRRLHFHKPLQQTSQRSSLRTTTGRPENPFSHYYREKNSRTRSHQSEPLNIVGISNPASTIDQNPTQRTQNLADIERDPNLLYHPRIQNSNNNAMYLRSSDRRPGIASDSSDFQGRRPDIASDSSDFRSRRPDIASDASDFQGRRPNIASDSYDFRRRRPDIASDSSDFRGRRPDIVSDSSDFQGKRGKVITHPIVVLPSLKQKIIFLEPSILVQRPDSRGFRTRPQHVEHSMEERPTKEFLFVESDAVKHSPPSAHKELIKAQGSHRLEQTDRNLYYKSDPILNITEVYSSPRKNAEEIQLTSPDKNDSSVTNSKSPGQILKSYADKKLQERKRKLQTFRKTSVKKALKDKSDYPTYQEVPTTNFSCKDVRSSGFYADIEAGCQVFHNCDAELQRHSFLCPNGTVFRQELLICDWWYNVRCEDATDFFPQ